MYSYYMMSNKDNKSYSLKQDSYRLDLSKISKSGFFDSNPANYKTYNEYVADQVETLPEIIMALFEYEGGDDVLFYIQLAWMNDFYKSRKKLVM